MWVAFFFLHSPTESPVSRLKSVWKFYDATGGPSWEDQPNWIDDSTLPLPLWDGVYFVPYGDGDESVGIELEFCNNSLKGEIPPEIFTINNMTSLLLYGNGLSGSILDNIGEATSLAKLRLDNNALTGNIPPSLSSLKYLRDFSVDGNMMSGTVPADSGDSAEAVYDSQPARHPKVGRPAGELKSEYLRGIAVECGGEKFL